MLRCHLYGADVNVILLTQLSQSDGSYIGLTDKLFEGNYSWIDGTTLDYLPNNITNNLNNKDCIYIDPTINYNWISTRCISNNTILCNKPNKLYNSNEWDTDDIDTPSQWIWLNCEIYNDNTDTDTDVIQTIISTKKYTKLSLECIWFKCIFWYCN